jgi:hypothetical protein
MKESIFAGIVVPALQALITGLFADLSSWTLGLLYRWDQAWLIALAIGAGVTLLTWTIAARHWQRVLELQRGVDLQPDPLPRFEPEPLPREESDQVTRVTVVTPDGMQGAYLDLPCSQQQLITLAAGLLRGETFTLGAWTGHGRPFSRADFERLRSELLARGALEWRNPTAPAQGLALSPPGRAMMRHFASMASWKTPTLSAREDPNR